MTMNSKNNLWFSTRFFVAITCFFGCAVIYSMRINLSVALVCMVNRTALELRNDTEQKKVAPECEETTVASNVSTIEGSLDWAKTEQGLLLSAFFYGYLLTQILGGWMAQKFGGTKIITANLLISIAVTFLTPVSTGVHFAFTVFLRIVLGFAQGVTFPAFHTFWSVWSPPMERSILTSISYAGCQVGNLITLPLSSMLCRYGFAGGWPSIFYVLAIFGAAWLCLWCFYVSDTPAKHKFMSQDEKSYLGQTVPHHHSGDANKKVQISTPWKAILTSVPVYAIFAAHWAGDWAAYMMLTCLPTFLRDVLRMDIEQLGFLSAVPYVAYFICINLSGFIADFLRSKQILSTANTRKLMSSIAFLSQAIFLMAAGYCTCGQQYLVIAFLTLGAGLSGFQYAGVLINYMDIAPAFAGTILGIGNTISCLSGILAPLAMGLLTTNGTRAEWLTMFWLTAAILVAGTLIYVIFAQGEVQSWAVVKTSDEEMKDLTAPEKERKSKTSSPGSNYDHPSA